MFGSYGIKALKIDVATAATALDGWRPGWHKQVNTDTLDIDNARCCVLGQLGGWYELESRLVQEGVIACDLMLAVFTGNKYTVGSLEEAWIEEIQARVQADLVEKKEYVLVS